MMYDGVIFDKDGVLIDSADRGFEWQQRLRAKLLNEKGADIDFEKARIVVEAEKPDEVVKFLESNGLSWQDISEAEKEIAKQKIEKIRKENIQLYPHVRDVLQAINMPMGVISNAPRRTVDFVINYYALGTYFEEVIAPEVDDMRKYIRLRKPSTQMLESLIDSTDLENPLMVGDSSADVKMAKRAGIDCCLVNPYKEYEDLNPKFRFESIEGLRKIPDITGTSK